MKSKIFSSLQNPNPMSSKSSIKQTPKKTENSTNCYDFFNFKLLISLLLKCLKLQNKTGDIFQKYIIYCTRTVKKYFQFDFQIRFLAGYFKANQSFLTLLFTISKILDLIPHLKDKVFVLLFHTTKNVFGI